MSRVLRESATAANMTFADLRATPGGIDHTACAPIGQRWIEGLVPVSGDGAIPFHPTGIGMQAAAPVVTAAARQAASARNTAIVKKVRGEGVCRGSQVRLRVLTGGGPVVRVDFKVGNKFLVVTAQRRSSASTTRRS
jgi:hypothetical protein